MTTVKKLNLDAYPFILVEVKLLEYKFFILEFFKLHN